MSAFHRRESSGVLEAAEWLKTQAEPPRLAVPVLREKFGLSAKEACEAIAIARTNQQKEAR